MKNDNTSQKLKKLRLRLGYSQEQLAEAARINLRTVQRVENGETEPRGDTLRRIASALNITTDELTTRAEQEDRGYLVAFNLSALSFLLFPFLGVLVPWVLWLLKRDKVTGLERAGRQLLNFQITGCIIYYLPKVIIITGVLFMETPSPYAGLNLGVGSSNVESSGIGMGVDSVFIYLFYLVAYYGITLIHIIISAYRAHVGKPLYYKPAIPFLR
ncbi:helix-turn-helix domain-containing protein [Mucilaginibacter auburnensis]|uniref:Putative Tic20 family protein n=1 Tax=Mucilaginibacter auburnensis TaxID=1457233 RepID=A0A2H9VRB7_9SPHI|nr:helix-turn-helix domain-containing protein [Mucilaginibacter auburnensis]PJJ83338.1 putative Tic20 family protein [Mucilaginibacter auburnensis]